MSWSTLYTRQMNLVIAHTSNSTSTSFSAKTPTTTKPSGNFVDDCRVSHLLAIPFGTDTDNQTFDLRFIGWRTEGTAWIPIHLGTITATLSSSLTGTADEFPNGTSDFLADTISPSSAEGNMDIVAGVGDEVPASVLVDPRGCELIEFDFDRTGAASANLLYTFL